MPVHQFSSQGTEPCSSGVLILYTQCFQMRGWTSAALWQDPRLLNQVFFYLQFWFFHPLVQVLSGMDQVVVTKLSSRSLVGSWVPHNMLQNTDLEPSIPSLLTPQPLYSQTGFKSLVRSNAKMARPNAQTGQISRSSHLRQQDLLPYC